MLLGIADAVAEARLQTRGFQNRWVRTRAGRLRVLEARGPGNGPPLVLLHGVGSRASDLAPLLQRLRGSASHLIAPDLPGHGRSGAPEGGMDPAGLDAAVTELLDTVAPSGALVFGNSLGGLVAARYAARRPGRVRALVLASPAGAPMDAGELAVFLSRFEVDDRAVAKAFVASTFARPPAPMLFLRSGLQARLRAPPVVDLLGRIRSSDLLDPEELSRVSCPTILIWGDAERLLPTSALSFFETHLAGPVRTIRLARAGHAPFVEAPGAVAGILRETLLHLDAASDSPLFAPRATD